MKQINTTEKLTPLHGFDAHELWEDPGIIRQRGWSRFGLISHLTSTAKCNLCIFTMACLGTLGAIKQRNGANNRPHCTESMLISYGKTLESSASGDGRVSDSHRTSQPVGILYFLSDISRLLFCRTKTRLSYLN